uniref:Uncharacterized protein n=1 Tax=Steinernema glaseri TaxID=37863 RepID=A0A1I8ASH7_9BILA
MRATTFTFYTVIVKQPSYNFELRISVWRRRHHLRNKRSETSHNLNVIHVGGRASEHCGALRKLGISRS